MTGMTRAQATGPVLVVGASGTLGAAIVAALELQVSTLRDALSDAQDQCSLFEKQCNWFKKMELELQLSRDRNSSASDLDYLRRLVASSRALCPAIY